MENKVLVTYATKYGSTREIAEKVGEVLRKTGIEIDFLPPDSIQDISPYSSVILGSAIYVGKWQKEAVDFLTKNEKILTIKPTWLFCSGPSGEGDPSTLVDGKFIPDNIKPVLDRIQPREVKVFHGNIDLQKINSIEKFAVKNIVKKPFGDYRDWNSIAQWAGKIAEAVKSSKP